MKTQQRLWSAGEGWRVTQDDGGLSEAGLVLYFAAPGTLDDGRRFAELRAFYPRALLAGCTTGGEILGQEVADGAVAATAIDFRATPVKAVEAGIGDWNGAAADLGRFLGNALRGNGLRCLFVLSDGTQVNGSDLVRGFKDAVGDGVPVMGGLAGDGTAFGATRVGLDANPQPGRVLAIGLYGDAIRIGHGSFGGWQAVGPVRRITRSDGNVLKDLDGVSALALYRKFLGEEAEHLPASGLLFPLRVHPKDQPGEWVVRTIIGIDDAADSMIFAGNMPEGHMAQMMLGNMDQIVAGAGRAAERARLADSQLAILVSCIGRKLLLGQRIAEEVEAVAAALGAGCRMTGFYSYGEIGPQEGTGFSDLHNQTMTITTIAEA